MPVHRLIFITLDFVTAKDLGLGLGSDRGEVGSMVGLYFRHGQKEICFLYGSPGLKGNGKPRD